MWRFGFWRDERGLAAVEFAFVLPIMVTMFFGLSELAPALSCRADVTNMASTGSDLVAQESTISATDMSNVFGALSAILYPFSTTPAQITITSIVDNGTATSGTVAWSCTQGGTARAKNSTYAFPASSQGLITPNGGGSVILTEISYTYTSPVSVYLIGNYTMSNSFYSKPRRVAQISLTGMPSGCNS